MRRTLLVLLALAALLGAAGALAWSQRISLAERWLRAQVAARGVAPAALRVARLDARGIALEGVAVGAPESPDLGAERVEGDWSWRALRERRFDALRLRGVRLRAALRDDGLTLGALDPLFRGDAAAGALALPARSIALEDARAQVATPRGVAEGSLGGTLDETAQGIAGSFALDVAGAGLRATGRLDVAGTLEESTFRGSLETAGEGLLAGKLAARGRVTRTGGQPSFEAALALDGVAVSFGALRASGIHGAIDLRGPPLHTVKRQTVFVGRVDAGVPLSEGLVHFALRRDGKLAVERAELALAGGTVWVEDLVVSPGDPRLPVTLRARDVDLARLLEMVTLPGLSGTGRLEGELPLALDASGLRVAAGLLRAAEGGGTIRYLPSESARALAESRPADLGLAVEAFSDFRFERLEARLDGDLLGGMKLALCVRGANPSFQDGRPVELNLSLEAYLADLVRGSVESYRVPGVIEQRIRELQERGGMP
jgi:hypothetical protein